MRLPLLARSTHKWLALVVGLQVVIWTLTGLYMTVVHIDIIHGDHFVRTPDPRPIPLQGLVEPATLPARFPGLRSLRLERWMDRPVYIVDASAGAALIDARTGERLSPVSEATVRAVARARFAGDAPIVKAELLRELPLEVQTRKPPLWRVEFAGWNKPTFYISPDTGELVSRRHELWRAFDFLWSLHIMDYVNRTDVNNPLLRAATVSAAVMAISGAWLLVYSFPRRRRRNAAAAARSRADA
ncbi:MAG TPA: PepSY domain-containing protein [Caulobacteraceae bacterium]|jgi:hypothetical protein